MICEAAVQPPRFFLFREVISVIRNWRKRLTKPVWNGLLMVMEQYNNEMQSGPEGKNGILLNRGKRQPDMRKGRAFETR